MIRDTYELGEPPTMSSALDALIAAFPHNPPETDISDKYFGDWLMRAEPGVKPLALFRPRSTQDVSDAMKIATAHRISVVPQGGLTGLTGGTVPNEGALLISMERMNNIEAVDPVSQTLTTQAGVPLEAIQIAADAAGMLFPLDIGSRGTCQIGGNLSTNAGGNRVLRYGMARAMVLGLEAVLADGTIVSSMNQMLKNNAAYDLKQIFIGSEGTLGIITRVVLRMAPKPRSVATSLARFADYAGVERFLGLARDRLGDSLSAFEVMWPSFYAPASAKQSAPPPLAPGAGCYVITEVSSSGEQAEAELSDFLEAAFEQGLAEDAVLAQSVQQTRAIWSIRDMGGELIQAFNPVGNFDISVPTSRIGAFVETCTAALEARWPGTTQIYFGHVCDGNVHLIAGGFGPDDLLAVEEAVYEVAQALDGSISAEHGIGLHKRDFLHLSRSADEIATMRRLKAAFDPLGLLNPGKVLV